VRREFRVVIGRGDVRAAEALAAAHIKVAGAPISEATGEQISDELIAVVGAFDERAARRRVDESLPSDGDYVIELVEPVESEGWLRFLVGGIASMSR
jgi:hypothetical protein